MGKPRKSASNYHQAIKPGVHLHHFEQFASYTPPESNLNYHTTDYNTSRMAIEAQCSPKACKLQSVIPTFVVELRKSSDTAAGDDLFEQFLPQ